MKLVIGNKNYSTWSMRPWVLLRQAGIAFEEVRLRFDAFTPESHFKRSLSPLTPTGKVPLLIDGDLSVWDSLAIVEYVAEKHPGKLLWPVSLADRARARSICAEMHSGFFALRHHFPMNIEAHLPEVGARILREQMAVQTDLKRLYALWRELLETHPAPEGLLFGRFSIADAYFAPMVMRLRTYGVPLASDLSAYVERVTQLPSVQAWIQDALAEKDFIAFEEPYRTQP
jgi:glutathione S-transferase